MAEAFNRLSPIHKGPQATILTTYCVKIEIVQNYRHKLSKLTLSFLLWNLWLLPTCLAELL